MPKNLAQERRKMYRYAKQVEQYEAMQKACSMDDPVVVPKYQAPRRYTGALGLPIGFPTFKYYTDSQKLQTFDDLYKQNKKTRGRLGS
jgi:hypothetical protein